MLLRVCTPDEEIRGIRRLRLPTCTEHFLRLESLANVFVPPVKFTA